MNAAIGQETRVTVLQMAMLYAAIANGGKLWLPQIVERIEAPTGQVLEEFPPRVRRELSVSAENLAIVRQALVGVVNETKGTAYKARPDDDLEVSGKTGTAQVRHMGKRGEPVSSYEQNDHAWFAGFAPSGRPRIAVAVLVEHGGFGGVVAAAGGDGDRARLLRGRWRAGRPAIAPRTWGCRDAVPDASFRP